MTSEVKIAPSILSADFAALGQEIRRADKAGADMIHIDVMDGHFVPNITIGPAVVKSIRKVTRLALDTHLMIERPDLYINAFADAGSDGITFHAESCGARFGSLIRQIKKRGLLCGVSIKPKTPVQAIRRILKDVDLVLLMTVNPGFGGQAFMPQVLPKIRQLRSVFSGDIQVDGGINAQTARLAVNAGANVLVAGSSVFGQPDIARAIRNLRVGRSCHTCRGKSHVRD